MLVYTVCVKDGKLARSLAHRMAGWLVGWLHFLFSRSFCLVLHSLFKLSTPKIKHIKTTNQDEEEKKRWKKLTEWSEWWDSQATREAWRILTRTLTRQTKLMFLCIYAFDEKLIILANACFFLHSFFFFALFRAHIERDGNKGRDALSLASFSFIILFKTLSNLYERHKRIIQRQKSENKVNKNQWERQSVSTDTIYIYISHETASNFTFACVCYAISLNFAFHLRISD